jgi:hypothetical protein
VVRCSARAGVGAASVGVAARVEKVAITGQGGWVVLIAGGEATREGEEEVLIEEVRTEAIAEE